MKITKSTLVIVTVGAILIAAIFIYSGKKRQHGEPKLPPASLIDARPKEQLSILRSNPVSDLNSSTQLNPIVEISNVELGKKAETEREHEPVVMTDYEKLAVIADDIQSYEDLSYAAGNVGVADRYGMFIVGNEATITHTNQTGSIDSVYLPGDASIEQDGVVISATDTEITYNPDGSREIHATNITLPPSSTADRIIINGEEINPQEYFADQHVAPTSTNAQSSSQ